MTIRIKFKTVGTAAIKLLDLDPERTAASIFNRGAAELFIGPTDGVATTDGYPIPAGQSGMLSPGDGHDVTSDLWGIASISLDVRVIEHWREFHQEKFE